MKFHKTITAPDSLQLDKELNKFLNQETIESVSYSVSAFAVSSAPVNIPGYQQQQLQVQVQTIYVAFIVYTVAAAPGAAPGTNTKFLS